MAKKGGVNKTQAIKDFKDSNPSAKPKEIAETLNSKGISVTPGYVSTVLSNSNKTGGRKTKKRGGGTVHRAVKKTSATRGGSRTGSSSASSGDVSVESLIKVKELVSELGGADEVRKVLSTYEKLMSK